MGWTEEELAGHYEKLKFCARCRGMKVISVKHGLTFGTDSAEEVALAYHNEPCPQCANEASADAPHVPEALIEAEVTKTLECDGWRALRTDPVSDRGRGKGFGEIGMADHLYIRYRWAPPLAEGDLLAEVLCEVMWIEFKRPGEKAKKHQVDWHIKERARGALTLIAGEDFPASVQGFRDWYKSSGLQRRTP